MLAALHLLAPPDRRFHGVVALVSVTAFAAVIATNSMLQLAVLCVLHLRAVQGETAPPP